MDRSVIAGVLAGVTLSALVVALIIFPFSDDTRPAPSTTPHVDVTMTLTRPYPTVTHIVIVTAPSPESSN